MAAKQTIDSILRSWPYQPGTISARKIRAHDGRDVLQMRIEMGLLQMETQGRPDGAKPEGAESMLDWLVERSVDEDEGFQLSEDQCREMDREFLQYYHRRVCWMALREFRPAVADADHTLALMDFAVIHAPNEDWAASHEEYRSFVLFHRTQAAALAELEESGPDAAMEEINRGLEQIRRLLELQDTGDESQQDEQVLQLVELKEWLRKEYHVGRTLEEQLADAVAAEQYERAAEIRDQLAHRSAKHS